MNILIMTGGSLDLVWASDFLEPKIKDKYFDRIIAADSGLVYCDQLGILPTDILGDFDSLERKEILDRYEKEKKIPVRHFPERKDYTDTELALFLAEKYDPEEIVILGGTGTRLDHSLANISLLIPLEEKGIHGIMVDSHNRLEIVTGPCRRVFRKPGTREFLSLIALTPVVSGITMEGFSYPLEDGDLLASTSLGISNEIVEEEGSITIKEGKAILIQAID